MNRRRCISCSPPPARLGALLVCLSVLAPPLARAHPVPREAHDRDITVRLSRDAVAVEYHLEVDQWTAFNKDLKAFDDQIDVGELTSPQKVYAAFAKCYGPVLADNLLVRLDGKPLPMRYVRYKSRPDLPDSLGWDFHFRADWKPDPGRPHQFTFKETNYQLQPGYVKLSLAADPSVRLLKATAPDEALKNRAAIELQSGDDDKLRSAAAEFEIGGRKGAVLPAHPTGPAAAAPAEGPRLLHLLLNSDRGLWVLLGLAAFFGAAHALTPGHGKTLVAAYLVGEHGTVLHALVLGLVVTLTHTGAVIVLAVILERCLPEYSPARTQRFLQVGGGLLVAGLGFWLLLRRLSGAADHVHIGGHGHHHHHHHAQGHADHYHDEHGHAHPLPDRSGPLGWWGLVVLGMSGGIVPCWDAIVMLSFAVWTQRLWLALPLLLAFSAGLAGVLVAVGIGVVYVKGFASSRWGESRLVRSLPVISAVCVTVLGLGLCYAGVHQGGPGPGQ